MSGNANGTPAGAAASKGFGASSRVLYDYFAFVMLEPVPLEGSDYLKSLGDMTDELLDEACDESASGPLEQMSAWISEALCGADPEEAQRRLAVDRTYLFRGVDEKGPLPPYEGFYSKAGESAIAAVGRAYADAGVHPSNNERCDYLGQEMAFVSVLVQKEGAARLREEGTSADELKAMLEEFEAEHLAPWVGSYCSAALPFARTGYFEGFLRSLDLWAGVKGLL